MVRYNGVMCDVCHQDDRKTTPDDLHEMLERDGAGTGWYRIGWSKMVKKKREYFTKDVCSLTCLRNLKL